MNWQLLIGGFVLGIGLILTMWGSQIESKGQYFSRTSDGSFVSVKDKWVYFTDKEGQIYPIISFNQMGAWSETDKKLDKRIDK